MTPEIWSAVDKYLIDLVVQPDAALAAALGASTAAGLPEIAVSPPQGKLLHLFAKLVGARTILEIGTLGGYSTIWLARALSTGGRLISLEADRKHVEVARVNLANAGLADIVEVRLGSALESLPQLTGPFDLIFIDADKENTPEYFTWALKLSHSGSLIIVDNVVRKGNVADPTSTDANVIGMRRFLAMLAVESRVSSTVIQTVGSKGYDGLAIARVE